MIELLDQYERMRTALKISKGRRTKVITGTKACGLATIKYKLDKKGKKIIIDKEKVNNN